MSDIYVKLDDVLAILPKDDTVGPKPSHIRKQLTQMDNIIPFTFLKMKNDEVIKYIETKE
jgi:hypothetical protein